MLHVGVDLDKRSSQIAVLTEDGEIRQQRLPNDARGLRNSSPNTASNSSGSAA